MIVLEKPLSKVYPEIDMVTTPDGSPVAMVHCNNCTTDLDSWIGLLKETVELMSGSVNVPKLYDTFYNKALEGAPDCGGLLSYTIPVSTPLDLKPADRFSQSFRTAR